MQFFFYWVMALAFCFYLECSWNAFVMSLIMAALMNWVGNKVGKKCC